MDKDRRIEELEEKVNILEIKMDKLLLKEKPNVEVGKRIESQRTAIVVPVKELEREQDPVDWEHVIARVWLPRIFIMVLLMGVIWGFKAASDVGFINETVRIVIGYISSGILIWFGQRQYANNRDALGQVLLGGSIGLLMLSTFAGHILYDLINGYVAFALNLIWIIGGIYLSKKYQSQSLAILASISGVMVPILVDGMNSNTVAIAAYEVILYGCFLYFAIQQKYIKLYLVSAVLLHVSFVFVAFISNGTEMSIIVHGAIVQQILLLTAFLKKEVQLKQQISTLLSSFALTYFWMRIGLEINEITTYLLINVFVYGMISYVMWKQKSDKLAVTLSISLFAFMMYLASFITNELLSVSLLIEGTLAFVIGCKIKSGLQRLSGFIVYGIGLLITYSIITNGMTTLISLTTLSWVTLLATIFTFSKIFKYYQEEFKILDVKTVRLLINGILIFLGLMFITEVIGVLTIHMSSNIQHLSVSIGWIVYAISGITYGMKQNSKNIRLVGVGLIFLTLLKVIFIDLPEVTILVRAILFIGLGVIGVIVSRFFYGSKDKSK